MSIVSVLGGLSAVNILSDPNSIQVPAGEITDYNVTASEKYVVVPINITNSGYFDITCLCLELRLEMRNATHSKEIFNGTKTFRTITPGEQFSGFFNATGINLNLPPSILNPELYADITVSLQYSLDLIALEVNIVDFNITSLLSEAIP